MTDNPLPRIRPFRDDDYDALAAARRAVDPTEPESAAGLRRTDAYLRARGFDPVRLLAEAADGRLLGYGGIVGAGEAPGVNLAVVPSARRHGIGTTLWEHLAATLRQRGARLARTQWIDETDDAALAFLARLGFRERERAWPQALDLAAFDPARFAGVEERVTAGGIAITTLAAEGAADPAVRRRVHTLYNACRRDQPPTEEHAEPVPFDAWVSDEVDGPSAIPEAYFLARAGDEYVGLSVLDRRGPPGTLHQGFTGVLPSHRGRGIATALKLRAIGYARDRGYRAIRTSNHAANAPMLRVNDTLGFRRTSASIRFDRPLT